MVGQKVYFFGSDSLPTTHSVSMGPPSPVLDFGPGRGVKYPGPSPGPYQVPWVSNSPTKPHVYSTLTRLSRCAASP